MNIEKQYLANMVISSTSVCKRNENVKSQLNNFCATKFTQSEVHSRVSSPTSNTKTTFVDSSSTSMIHHVFIINSNFNR